ncbi:MAG: purine-nucleoside phosphorylase [Alphaproteobacteria bacterium]|nr:purine-nucleoside phosphorylase [Alphaproteobacteria bacterium]
MTSLNQQISQSAALIREQACGLKPRLAVILGSGLGAVADLLTETASIPYTSLPGFPQPTIEGHEGSFKIGTVNNVPVYYLKGRVHLYEGVGVDALKVMIRTLKTLDVETVIITNAAGGLHEALEPGSLMAISDHINLTGLNPLTGPNDDDWGTRFPSQEGAWNDGLRTLLIKGAAAQGVTLHQGVYCMHLGPTFETPAEIRMVKTIGGDAVGMSTIPENILARHCGMECVGLAAIVNRAAGMGFEKPSHEQTLIGARLAENNMAAALGAFISAYNIEAASQAA